MINKIFAQNFIRKIERSLNLKVNVMDERGVIIASSTKERIGDFHICAYEIIQNKLPVMITTEPTKELIGVNAPGVNLRLTSSGETIGVIGVSGPPDEVGDIAKMVKLTFETMYEYEYKKSARMKGSDSVWNLSHILLVETPTNTYSIEKATDRLKLYDNYPRIPIYISFYSEYLTTIIQHFIDYYSTLSFAGSQDIILPVEHGVLLFKSFADVKADYTPEEYTDLCIEKLKTEFIARESIDNQNLTSKFFVGPIQLHFSNYQSIYQNLLWLSARQTEGRKDIFRLADNYLELLITNHHDNDFLGPLYEYYLGLIENNLELDYFSETVAALISSDMKLEQASRLLHLHKNSVIARLKKIKEVLNINPIASSNDAAFLRCLYAYSQLKKDS